MVLLFFFFYNTHKKKCRGSLYQLVNDFLMKRRMLTYIIFSKNNFYKNLTQIKYFVSSINISMKQQK